jgi:TonB family protein
MTLAIISCVLAVALTKPISVVEPAYPPNAVAGGTVVATLQIVSAEVREVTILTGDEPFASSTRVALKSWQFSPGDAHIRLPVIVSYRNPALLTSAAAVQNLSPPALTKENQSLPYPIQIVESGYPPNALGQGSAVLQISIDAAGSVARVETVKSLGSLTEACTSAVRKWRFRPAQNRQGRRIPSDAFAVCVYRMLVTSGQPPK